MASTTLQRTEVGGLVTTDGEVAFDPRIYLASLDGGGLKQQQALAAAYDAACAALIGPNDVQVDGGRSFKKKSAWRKLARHFRVSTAVQSRDVQPFGDAGYLASVVVRAVAPWGQSADAVGACGSDEATGRRVITLADALATAETRATNRAVSNLIAMGEVTAEEIGNRAPIEAPRRPAPVNVQAAASNGAPVIPFGKTKGTPLAKLDNGDLSSALAWAESKGKFEEFQAAARVELAHRNRAVAVQGGPGLDEVPVALQEDGDDLGF